MLLGKRSRGPQYGPRSESIHSGIHRHTRDRDYAWGCLDIDVRREGGYTAMAFAGEVPVAV
jgi:hypothetical protein